MWLSLPTELIEKKPGKSFGKHGKTSDKFLPNFPVEHLRPRALLCCAGRFPSVASPLISWTWSKPKASLEKCAKRVGSGLSVYFCDSDCLILISDFTCEQQISWLVTKTNPTAKTREMNCLRPKSPLARLHNN